MAPATVRPMMTATKLRAMMLVLLVQNTKESGSKKYDNCLIFSDNIGAYLSYSIISSAYSTAGLPTYSDKQKNKEGWLYGDG